MPTIRQTLKDKGQTIWSVPPDDTVFSAIQLMAEKRIGALLVMDGSHLAGIVSERDYAREVILKGRSSKDTPVKDIMTTRVVTVSPSYRVKDALEVMTKQRIRHLPIVENDHVEGIVSIGDLVKNLIEELQTTIDQLENFIKGQA